MSALRRGSAAEESEMQVVVSGPADGVEAKDDLLFVHGWPDCGEMWDAQVQ